MIFDILQLVLYGLVLGSILALCAVGVSITFGILGFANFSHGDLMTLGAYLAFLFYIQMTLPFWLALALAGVATAGIAIAFDALIYKKLRGYPNVYLLIASFGVALIIRSLIQLVWGPNTLTYESGIQMSVRFAGLRLKPDQMLIIFTTLALIVALHFFLTRTRTGTAMRATADNPELARLTGINTERVIMLTWIIGGGLAAIAGIFLGLDTRLHSEMGWHILLPVFAAAILGGIGQPYGAILGGYVIGIVQEVSTLFIEPNYKPAVAFAIMVIMLLVRPTGLMGKKEGV